MLLAYQPHERGEVVRDRLAVVIGQRAEHHDRRDQEVFSRSRFLSIGCTCRKHRRTLLSLRARGAPRRQGSPATRLCFWCLLAVNGGITRQLISSPIGPISTMDLARSSTAQRDTVLTVLISDGLSTAGAAGRRLRRRPAALASVEGGLLRKRWGLPGAKDETRRAPTRPS